jgi:hypothetical protein
LRADAERRLAELAATLRADADRRLAELAATRDLREAALRADLERRASAELTAARDALRRQPDSTAQPARVAGAAAAAVDVSWLQVRGPGPPLPAAAPAVEYEPVARKEAGTAIGFVAASRPGDERFLAKLGLPDVRSVRAPCFLAVPAHSESPLAASPVVPQQRLWCMTRVRRRCQCWCWVVTAPVLRARLIRSARLHVHVRVCASPSVCVRLLQRADVALTTRRRQARTVVSAITELFAADVYAALGRGAFYVPQHRLAVLPRMNQFTRDNALAIALDEEIRATAPGSTRGLFILSRWVAEYRDLAELQGCLREQARAVVVVAGGGGGNKNAGVDAVTANARSQPATAGAAPAAAAAATAAGKKNPAPSKAPRNGAGGGGAAGAPRPRYPEHWGKPPPRPRGNGKTEWCVCVRASVLRLALARSPRPRWH